MGLDTLGVTRRPPQKGVGVRPFVTPRTTITQKSLAPHLWTTPPVSRVREGRVSAGKKVQTVAQSVRVEQEVRSL